MLGAATLLTGLWSVELPAPVELVDLLASGLRLLAAALLGYLLVAATLNLVLAALLRPATRRIVPGAVTSGITRCTPRWLAAATLGAVVGSGALTPGVVAARSAVDLTGTPGPHDDVMLEVVEPNPSGTDGPRTMLPWADAPQSAAGPATRLPPPPLLDTAPDAAGNGGARRAPDAEAAPSLQPVQAPTPAPARLEHVVQPGEHFWSIAEQVVEQRGADANADAESDVDVDVESYWGALVAANRDRLVDPDDTDLLHPGQVLVLP
jgi:nucleoid-associated protein YgaU